eukprot:8171676-Pyramimonas_sp.AAC.1
MPPSFPVICTPTSSRPSRAGHMSVATPRARPPVATEPDPGSLRKHGWPVTGYDGDEVVDGGSDDGGVGGAH